MDENEEFEFRARAEAEAAMGGVPHTPTQISSMPSGNSSPFALPKINPDIENKTMMSQYASTGVNPWQFSKSAQKAAQSGVDVNSGAPWALRSRMDLAKTPDETVRAIQGAGYQTRQGPDSGQLEFFNKDTNRWTTAQSMNPRSVGAPTAPDLAKTAAITAAAAVAPEGVLPMIGATGLGAAGAEGGASIVSQALGIKRTDPNKLVQTDVVKNMALEGGKAAAWAGAGAAVSNLPTLIKYARYGPTLFSAPVLDSRYWPQIAKGLSDAQSSLEDYYELAGNRNLQLDVAQLSQHPAAQIGLEEAQGKLKSVAVDYALRGKENLSNLQQTFKEVSDGIIGPGDFDPMSSGQNVVEWAAEQKAAALAQQKLHQKVITDDAKRTVDGLPAMSKDEINQRVTDQLRLIERSDKETVDKAYGDLAVKLGVPPQVAYEQNSERYLFPQEHTVDFQLTPLGAAKMRNYIDEARRAGAVDSAITGGKLNAIPDGFLNKDGSLNTDPKDMYWVLQSIKGLRSGVRSAAARANGWIPPDAQDAARVAEILGQDAKYRLYNSSEWGALEALENAEQQAKVFGDKWRDSVLSEAAEKYNGFSQYPLSSAVNHALFKSGVDGDKTALSELAKISNGDPQFQDSIRQSILATYRSQYTRDGIPTPELHAKFLEDMDGPIKAFFTPVEQAQIDHLKALGDVVAKRSADVAKFNNIWKSSPYGGIPANSMQIAKAAFSQSSRVQGIGTFLGKYNPALLKELQQDTALQLSQKVLGPNGDAFNVATLDKVLNSATGKNLQDIMPPEYVDSLRTISKTAHMMTGSPGVFNPAEESLIHRVVKFFTGAWGPEARGYHLMRGFREKQAARFMYNTLSDPDKMRQFMALKDQNIAVARKAGLLTAVGAYGLGQEDSPQ